MSNPSIWAGEASVAGSSEAVRMMLLTLPLVGLQFTWGMEMTYCTPYLLELGLTKSKTSLVWVAGPLSGLLIAPVVGAIADKSKSKWGRRRPFMIGGTLAVCVCLFVLGWAKEITALCLGYEASQGTYTVLLAVASIYVLDFAINTVQWSSRSLIVDILPISKQQTGSAWASRSVALGHCLGYMIGALDMESIMGNSMGATQFKTLIVIAALALLSSVSIASLVVSERVLVSDGLDGDSRIYPVAIIKEILTAMFHMPRRMTAVCWVVFWAWIGWLPFMFYSSQWIGEIALREIEETQQTQPQDRLALIGRKGSTALVWFSVVALIGALLLPRLVQGPEDEDLGRNSKFTPRPPPGLSTIVRKLRIDRLNIQRPTLVTSWLLSHYVFAFALGCTPFVTSVGFAELLVALCGIPSALSQWAPHAFMGFEINKIDSVTLSKAGTIDGDNVEMAGPTSHRQSHDGIKSYPTAASQESHSLAQSQEGENRSGVYLGILNVFITLPQFIGAFNSAIVFWILDKPGEEAQGQYNSIGVCFFVGALAALGAAYATHVLRKIS